jgi:hypothetical protein
VAPLGRLAASAACQLMVELKPLSCRFRAPISAISPSLWRAKSSSVRLPCRIWKANPIRTTAAKAVMRRAVARRGSAVAKYRPASELKLSPTWPRDTESLTRRTRQRHSVPLSSHVEAEKCRISESLDLMESITIPSV